MFPGTVTGSPTYMHLTVTDTRVSYTYISHDLLVAGTSRIFQVTCRISYKDSGASFTGFRVSLRDGARQYSVRLGEWNIHSDVAPPHGSPSGGRKNYIPPLTLASNWEGMDEPDIAVTVVENSSLEKLPPWMFVFVFLCLGVTFTIVIAPCIMTCLRGNQTKCLDKKEKEKQPHNPTAIVWKRVFIVVLYLALNLFCCLCFSVTLPFLLWRNLCNSSDVTYPRIHSSVDNRTTSLHSYFEGKQDHVSNNPNTDIDSRDLIGCHRRFDDVTKGVWRDRLSGVKRKTASVGQFNLQGLNEYMTRLEAVKTEFVSDIDTLIDFESQYTGNLLARLLANDLISPLTTNHSKIPGMLGLTLTIQTRDLVRDLKHRYALHSDKSNTSL
jgi:hypothetical protein